MRVILSKKSVSFSMNKKWRATVRNLLTSRLPPSDLLQQQAQNGSRQRGMNLLSACPRCSWILAVFWCREQELYLAKHNTQIMSWGPFAEWKNDFFNTPVLKEIGAKYGKSVAQVALRFLLQNGVVVIPKSTHEERMQENFNVFDFVLTED